jgi:hypothetical protein
VEGMTIKTVEVITFGEFLARWMAGEYLMAPLGSMEFIDPDTRGVIFERHFYRLVEPQEMKKAVNE